MSVLKDKPLKKCHTDKRKMIDDIHSEMVSDLSESELNNYYLDNGFLLDQYYRSDKTSVKNGKIDGGILSYFDKKTENIEDNDKTMIINIMNEYLSNIDDHILSDKYKDIKNDICDICNGQMLMSDLSSEIFCSLCGGSKKVMIITDKVSYSDPQSEITYYTYKRINHFNEWLAQFQAKERTDLPSEIYVKIIDELKKNTHVSQNDLKYIDIREILKKLKFNKYYEHIPYILSVITGHKAPILDRKNEEILRSLFKEIQIPFMNNCPPSRKNFLSYSYVLHKFCELLEYDHLLEYFTLLKSREKLHAQDLIWEKICKDLTWEFIPSL
tara:strand:+ start:643 stop:1623 length:981 start_codon:yes stop_codon:yes gene_type:complete